MLRQNLSSSSVAMAASSRCSWLLMLFGLFYMVMQGDARAVNVSNTWTMPQEGLNVFYRFFRDRISWFEADAVCQFHHANLVTVDNSFQFDATRDLLRELDVNDIVWIGLMRPQSSDRFMWSNSRPLVADTGYWAESLPLMDAPLCAVIDPIRDYRWHALRCGGPETASFLCEMPVPNWADTCILKDMPNLTMQYMADTASIELIRNCQEEGLLRTTCRGKQDRDRALQDLICPRERLEAQRINDITNSHFKSLQIINSIPSDNNENNDIELLPMEVNYGSGYPEELQTEKNTVQRLIEQFNVDELMQGDEPANMDTVSSFYKMPGLIPKPVKKSAKKVLEYPKKTEGKKVLLLQDAAKDKARVALEMDDMMLGDQPMQGEPEMPEQILNEEVSNEIMEPLPHIKKTNIHKGDMEQMEKKAIAIKESMQKLKEMELKKLAAMSTTTTTTTTTTEAVKVTEIKTTTEAATTTTTESPKTTTAQPITPETTTAESTTLRNTETPTKQRPMETSTEAESSTPSAQTSTSTAPATIGHPMHPQQPRSNVIVTDESQHLHVKESPDNSHFIPPMLLVKSHYVPPTNKHGHNEQHHSSHLDMSAATTNDDLMQMTKRPAGSNAMMMTTPKVIDLNATIKLKDLDSINEQQQQQQQLSQQELKEKHEKTEEEHTTKNSNMKPITQKNMEQEKHYNSEYMNFEETQTTRQTATKAAIATATTTETPLTTTMKQKHSTGDGVATTLQTTTIKLVQGNDGSEYNDNSNDDDAKVKETGRDVQTTSVVRTTTTATSTAETKELKPQTDIEMETTEKTAKLVDETIIKAKNALSSSSAVASSSEEATEQKHDLVTEATQSATATTTMPAKQMEYVKEAMEKSDFELTQQQSKEQQQQQQQPEAAEIQSAMATTTTKAEHSLETTMKPARRLILATDIQALQGTDIHSYGEMKYNNGQQEEEAIADKDKELTNDEMEDDKEQFGITTTEVLTTKMTATAITTSTMQPYTTTAGIVKPVTNTFIPATTTELIIEESKTNANTNNNSRDSSTKLTKGLTTTAPQTNVAQQEHANLLESSPVTVHSTTSPTITTTTTAATTLPAESTPETTKNFLKVTTEMPYKPNRRRSLTKPETVSYMKKILG